MGELVSPAHKFLIIMWTAIALVISAVLATVIGGVSAGLNKQAVEDTNQKNLQAVQETNSSNVEQAELAYRRSLPTAQIRQLMDAGMSRPAALASLTGGGTYQAPVLQSARADAPQMDLSSVSAGLERLGGVPSNVEQSNFISEQRNALAIETQNKIKEEKRRQDMHEFDLWSRQYGKENATALDAARTKTVQALLDSGKEFKDFSSFEDMLRQLGLDKDASIRNMPSIARSQFEESVRNSFAETRAQNSAQDAHTAAQDAHDLAEKEKVLKQIDIDLRKIDKKYYDSEKHAQLLGLMRSNENLLQDGKIKFQDARSKEFENYVREAGIDSEAEARSLAEYLKVLSNNDEIDLQMRRRSANDNTLGTWNQTRVLLRDLGELLFHVKLGS